MITKFFCFILVFICVLTISNFITQNSKERFQETTKAQTTQAQTTQAQTTQAQTTEAENNEVILDDYETIPQETELETNYDNYFQGGFCKYQQKLGYEVGCSQHIYDNAFFDIDRELNSVKQNYSILKS